LRPLSWRRTSAKTVARVPAELPGRGRHLRLVARPNEMPDRSAKLRHGARALPDLRADIYGAQLNDAEGKRWGALTIGTGLGNARFTNRRKKN
jgi:hypothetical protein